jgi:hypothetical protein
LRSKGSRRIVASEGAVRVRKRAAWLC